MSRFIFYSRGARSGSEAFPVSLLAMPALWLGVLWGASIEAG